jgi:hypoxanthine phosphoribosyltransferase
MNRYYPPEKYGQLHGDVSRILLSEEEIEQRVRELGDMISRDYEDQNPLLVGVLKGGVPFMADLLRMITIPVEIDFMAVSSYSKETRDRGLVRLQKDLDVAINGRHVLFVEHIIDTGLTINYLLRNLRARNPLSLKVCALFDKSRRRLIDVPIKYKGFDLPDRFVVGYGLDFRERYRNLPFVGILKSEVLHAKNNSS